MRAVREFASSGAGTFVPDGPGMGAGRLVVAPYEIDLAKAESHTFVNEDGEDVALVLSVVAVGA